MASAWGLTTRHVMCKSECEKCRMRLAVLLALRRGGRKRRANLVTAINHGAIAAHYSHNSWECQTPKWSKDCTARLFINSSLSGVCHTHTGGPHCAHEFVALGLSIYIKARAHIHTHRRAARHPPARSFPRRRAGVEIVIWTKFTLSSFPPEQKPQPAARETLPES